MMSNTTHALPDHPSEKSPETVEKDVRKWVESVCDYKANLDMEKCEFPQKKLKKVRKTKTKKKLSLNSVGAEEKTSKIEQETKKSKPTKKKVAPKEPKVKESNTTPSTNTFDNLKENYKSVKLPLNWVSGQSRGKIVFSRVKVISRESHFEMVSDRGIAITNDCMIHVFINGMEIILNNWKVQKVESIDDLRKVIKAVDAFKICSGALPNGIKSPSCSIFLSDDTKTCQACKSDISHLKVSGTKVKANVKTKNKPSASFQK